MCLEKDPDDRFESAHDLAQMLRAVSDTHGTSTVRPSAPTRRTWPAAATAAMAVAVAALIGWGIWQQLTEPVMPQPQHIAVLPFVAAGDDPDREYLAAGMSATVADGLTVMERETRGAVWVLPPTVGATIAKARQKDNATIGLRGVLACGEGRVRLEIELVEAATGRVLVRRTLDEDARNLTGLQKGPVLLVWEMLESSTSPSGHSRRPSICDPISHRAT
jgi:TolB-like protein